MPEVARTSTFPSRCEPSLDKAGFTVRFLSQKVAFATSSRRLVSSLSVSEDSIATSGRPIAMFFFHLFASFKVWLSGIIPHYEMRYLHTVPLKKRLTVVFISDTSAAVLICSSDFTADCCMLLAMRNKVWIMRSLQQQVSCGRSTDLYCEACYWLQVYSRVKEWLCWQAPVTNLKIRHMALWSWVLITYLYSAL